MTRTRLAFVSGTAALVAAAPVCAVTLPRLGTTTVNVKLKPGRYA